MPTTIHQQLYTAYGYCNTALGTASFLGFTGQRQDTATNCYPLGNGYRNYSPALKRFYSPDSASPFGIGGVNAYAYCNGDPVNHQDPSGHGLLSALTSRFRGKTVMQRRDKALAAIEKNPALKTYQNIAESSVTKAELKNISDLGKALDKFNIAIANGDVSIDGNSIKYSSILDPFEQLSFDQLELKMLEKEIMLDSLLSAYPAQQSTSGTPSAVRSLASPTSANKSARTS